jgi:hypothetical protein
VKKRTKLGKENVILLCFTSGFYSCGPWIVQTIVTRRQLGRSGNRGSISGRIWPPDSFWGHPESYQFPHGLSSLGVELTTHLHLEPRLRMRWGTPPFPHVFIPLPPDPKHTAVRMYPSAARTSDQYRRAKALPHQLPYVAFYSMTRRTDGVPRHLLVTYHTACSVHGLQWQCSSTPRTRVRHISRRQHYRGKVLRYASELPTRLRLPQVAFSWWRNGLRHWLTIMHPHTYNSCLNTTECTSNLTHVKSCVFEEISGHSVCSKQGIPIS